MALAPAVEEALRVLPKNSAAEQILVLVTDGQVSGEAAVMKRVTKAAKGTLHCGHRPRGELQILCLVARADRGPHPKPGEHGRWRSAGSDLSDLRVDVRIETTPYGEFVVLSLVPVAEVAGT